jgi:hypothetical protein
LRNKHNAEQEPDKRFSKRNPNTETNTAAFPLRITSLVIMGVTTIEGSSTVTTIDVERSGKKTQKDGAWRRLGLLEKLRERESIGRSEIGA